MSVFSEFLLIDLNKYMNTFLGIRLHAISCTNDLIKLEIITLGIIHENQKSA